MIKRVAELAVRVGAPRCAWWSFMWKLIRIAGNGRSRLPPFRTERGRMGHPSFICDLVVRLKWVGDPGLEEWVYDVKAVDLSRFLHIFRE
jgi:predicted small integral membrane protein